MIRVDVNKKWDGEIVKVLGKKVTKHSSYEIGLVVEEQAKLLAARRYGYLAASINTQSNDLGDDVESPSKYRKKTPPANHDVGTFRKISKPNESGETLVGTAVDYAPYQEFGTVKMDAAPFLRPALELAKGKSLDIVTINSKKHFLGYLIEHEKYLRSRGI
jgi:HK97 gp10 family phage protein